MNTLTLKGSKEFTEQVFCRIPNYGDEFMLIRKGWRVTGVIIDYKDREIREVTVLLTEVIA